MKCFVTGATGHIGNVLVKLLFEEGHKVTSLVLKNDDIRQIEPYCNVIYGDILEYNNLVNSIKGNDIVFHLASMIEIGFGKKKKTMRVNVEGTKNVLKACQETGVKKLIYTSSVHAIEELPHGVVMSEAKVFDPDLVKGNYAKSKAIATNIVINQKCESLKTIVVCPSGVIGPNDYQLSNTGQVFIDYILGRLTAYISGGYNFVDVRDVARGIYSASIKGKNKESYILSGEDITIKELLDLIAEYSGKKKIKTKLAYWFIYAMSFFAELYYMIRKQKPLFTHYSLQVLRSNHLFDNSKANKELDFKTRPIKESIYDAYVFSKEYYLVKKGKKWKKRLIN